MKQGFVLALIAASGLTLEACSVMPMGIAPSSAQLSNNDGTPRPYKIIAKVEGGSGFFSLFGLFPFGEIDIQDTFDEIAQKNGGDALVNVRYWRRFSNYLIGTQTSLEVQADVIKFEK
jgi:hypothetical protein